MDKRKKVWMATFGAILMGHAYGQPREPVVMEIDVKPLAVQPHKDRENTTDEPRIVITASPPRRPECP